jgi:hypothetical protein
MLDHLRNQVIETLAPTRQITLTTGGIAGLQTSVVPCESMGLCLYVRVPRMSDHLANIEDQPECVAVTEAWELRGVARRIAPSDYPPLALARASAAEWDALIEIRPTRLQIARRDGVGYAATIDID